MRSKKIAIIQSHRIRMVINSKAHIIPIDIIEGKKFLTRSKKYVYAFRNSVDAYAFGDWLASTTLGNSPKDEIVRSTLSPSKKLDDRLKACSVKFSEKMHQEIVPFLIQYATEERITPVQIISEHRRFMESTSYFSALICRTDSLSDSDEDDSDDDLSFPERIEKLLKEEKEARNKKRAHNALVAASIAHAENLQLESVKNRSLLDANLHSVEEEKLAIATDLSIKELTALNQGAEIKEFKHGAPPINNSIIPQAGSFSAAYSTSGTSHSLDTIPFSVAQTKPNRHVTFAIETSDGKEDKHYVPQM